MEVLISFYRLQLTANLLLMITCTLIFYHAVFKNHKHNEWQTTINLANFPNNFLDETHILSGNNHRSHLNRVFASGR